MRDCIKLEMRKKMKSKERRDKKRGGIAGWVKKQKRLDGRKNNIEKKEKDEELGGGGAKEAETNSLGEGERRRTVKMRLRMLRLKARRQKRIWSKGVWVWGKAMETLLLHHPPTSL